MPATSKIVTGPDRVDVTDARRLRVNLPRGAATVVSRTEPGVEVTVEELTGEPLEIATEGDQVRVGPPATGWDGWIKRFSAGGAGHATVRVAVGPQVGATVWTAAADVTVQDVAEDCTIASATGTVRTQRTTGGLTVRTASGDLTVSDHTGPVTVTTASGAVEVGGDVPRLSVTTASGDVRVAQRAPSSVVTVTGASADVTLTLGEGIGLDLTVRTVTGDVLVDGTGRRSGSRPGTTSVVEPGVGGTCFAKVSTVSGGVVVDRQGLISR